MKIRISQNSSDIWNLHSHSQFSKRDALPEVKDMVATVAGYGQPALGLTDHGNMAGSVQLYTHCRKAGILPFPGSELYVVDTRENKKAKRRHMCVVAYTSKGYENLVGLSTMTHKNFFNMPLIDHSDLATLADQGLLEGIAATSGCFFSETSQAVVEGNLDQAKVLLRTYAGWFPKFYVELQNHDIQHDEEGWTDDRLANELHSLATELSLPCVLTQDAHYCHTGEKQVHEVLKRIVSWGPDPDDAVFPGDGFQLADDEWFVRHHGPSRLAEGSAGLRDLLNSHDLKIPELDTYSYNIPFTVADPMKDLSARCREELIKRDLVNKKGYLERFMDELAIVKDTGMAGYLVLVAEVTDWCRDNRVFYQARGSASGSIICWLIGITQVDPIKWDLRFERFISRDRTKPPDIDLDVEHDRRKDLIEWLRTRFAVQQIGTWVKFSLKGETLDVEGWDDSKAKGSLRVAYYARLRSMGLETPEWENVSDVDKRELYLLDKSTSLSSYGTHAAGLIITSTQKDIDRIIPLMMIASSETLVSQYDMHDVESLGMVKLDVLGLKTLSVLNRAMVFMQRDVLDGLEWIPLSDGKTYRAIAKGNTEGVFQLEGGAARRGCRDLRPTKIADLVAAMALFRPATMDSGATEAYIARKQKTEVIPERHRLIAKNTASTYGIMLFQEQVISILRELGMGPDQLTDFLKAIKASQKHEIAKAAKDMDSAKSVVAGMAEAAGMTDADFTWLWNAIEGFSKYGFNQAHSTAYGLTAYRTAYLTINHPLEYFAGLLSVAAGNKKKEPIYVSAAKRRDIRLIRANVNDSGISYAPDANGKGIRRGLKAVEGIGDKQANEIVIRRPADGYQTLEQMCRMVYRPRGPVTGIKPYLESGEVTVGTIGKLYVAGALECFEEVPTW